MFAIGDRDCSLQRRHQKIIEEAPAPGLLPETRRALQRCAIDLAREVGYVSAGTVEFLLDWQPETRTKALQPFYFLEMNTRLQVEHPVTEQVTGVDLVRAQIAVAAGERLPWPQADLTQRGHAIEVRIYAEDPVRDHLPQAGPLLLYREPVMPGVRIDAGVVEGSTITVHYDPMIAKLIATAETRDAARLRALAALRSYPILGIRTNIPFLIELLEHPRFVNGDFDTHFLEHEGQVLRDSLAAEPPEQVAALMTALGTSVDADRAIGLPPAGPSIDPWNTLRDVRV